MISLPISYISLQIYVYLWLMWVVNASLLVKMCMNNCMNELSAQIIKWLVCFLFPGSENAGLHLALCVLILSEILAKVAHQTSYRTMWAAENMLYLQARGTKDIQGGWVKESQMSVFVCFFYPCGMTLTCLSVHRVEYSLRSSKNKVRKC